MDFIQAGGAATVIYSHNGGVASAMKFARKDVSNGEYPEYIYDVNRQLGIVFKKSDGTSDFVVLDLTIAGKPEHIQEYKGQFGNIKDVVFL